MKNAKVKIKLSACENKDDTSLYLAMYILRLKIKYNTSYTYSTIMDTIGDDCSQFLVSYDLL